MLASLLGSETRARVLALLLAQPPRTYHVRELIRLTGGGASGVQREIGRLEALGLVVSERPPRDLDVLVRLSGPLEGRAARYFALRAELERASGLPVDLVEEEAVTNPYLRDEIERTGVVILEAA